ncbi:phenylacetate--CoA ligase family protein [Paucibacter sp. B2R-40]|uniref:phenylacetate--CoA ligase family protein n=1 Tax=Paucibacter sp. B2R-40 TaxID=2893554 RepID=UPI0021E3F350|nr:phenylacetate--CoA ligase family protein [Paucibacter sp. B2R-40]MCV2354812.1 phenylacetate--CoA ligase family protein [Paucibacter sp. B2R-40]
MYASAIQTERIADLQSQRLQALLRAAQATPFYRPLLQGCQLNRLSLQALPVVNKTALMQNFEQHVSDPQLKLPDLQTLCQDASRIAESYLGRYTVWESSGSSGQPGIYVQDQAAMAVYENLEATRRHSPRPWARLWDPLYLSERFAFVGALGGTKGGHFASHVSVQRLRRAQPWMTHQWRSFSILQSTPALLAQLDAFAPNIIATYPTAALLLAEEYERGALHCRPQEIWTGGETLSATMRKRIECAFGCPLRNSYGASEFLPLAWECAQGHLHLNADWVILEPVDAQYRPTPLGQTSHTTLLTNLANHVQPLIRFDIGDSVTVAAELCDCGSALPVLEVQGRRDDMLYLPDRTGGRLALLPLALTTVLEDEAELFDFQLQQLGPTALRLCLSAKTDHSRPARERCRHVLRNFLLAQGCADISLSICCSQAFKLGRSGKLKRILALP